MSAEKMQEGPALGGQGALRGIGQSCPILRTPLDTHCQT